MSFDAPHLRGQTSHFSLYSDGSLWLRCPTGPELNLGPVETAFDPREFPLAAEEWLSLKTIHESLSEQSASGKPSHDEIPSPTSSCETRQATADR